MPPSRLPASLLYLPPDSPDFNPIEKAYSKLKALLRKAAERFLASLWDAIGRLIDCFTPEECQNFFLAAGYEPISAENAPSDPRRALGGLLSNGVRFGRATDVLLAGQGLIIDPRNGMRAGEISLRLRLARIALGEALRQGRASPDEIAALARQAGLWSIIEPHLARAGSGYASDDARSARVRPDGVFASRDCH